MQGLGEFATIAYPACLMECLEFWAYGIMFVMAGLLPNAAPAVAALGIVIEIYDVAAMLYLAQLVTLSTRCVAMSCSIGSPWITSYPLQYGQSTCCFSIPIRNTSCTCCMTQPCGGELA